MLRPKQRDFIWGEGASFCRRPKPLAPAMRSVATTGLNELHAFDDPEGEELDGKSPFSGTTTYGRFQTRMYPAGDVRGEVRGEAR